MRWSVVLYTKQAARAAWEAFFTFTESISKADVYVEFKYVSITGGKKYSGASKSVAKPGNILRLDERTREEY